MNITGNGARETFPPRRPIGITSHGIRSRASAAESVRYGDVKRVSEQMEHVLSRNVDTKAIAVAAAGRWRSATVKKHISEQRLARCNFQSSEWSKQKYGVAVAMQTLRDELLTCEDPERMGDIEMALGSLVEDWQELGKLIANAQAEIGRQRDKIEAALPVIEVEQELVRMFRKPTVTMPVAAVVPAAARRVLEG